MENNPDPVLFVYTRYTALAGVGLYLLIVTLGYLGVLDPEDYRIVWFKRISWALVITPLCVQWYFSKYAILWFSGLMCAGGIAIKIRKKMGI